MKNYLAGLCALALLSVIPVLPSVQAQTPAAAKDSVRPFTYNVSDEVTLKGTVSSVLTKPTHGMIMGSHLLVSTSSGTVDASLGMFGLRGKGAVQAKAGDHIEMTGIMKTIKGQHVFLTRTVKADNQLYTVRNEHGFPVSPQARERANHKPATKGEAL